MLNKYILSNLRIISPFTANRFIERGYIVITGAKISAVGAGNPPDTADFKVYDLPGKTVLPGMINAHTHLYSTLALGMPAPADPPINFVEKLERVWWPLDRALDEESINASFSAGLVECLINGVTTVIDHHSSPNSVPGSLESLAQAAERMNMNVAAAFELTDRNGPRLFKAGLEENLDFFQRYCDHPLIRPLIGLHASFTLADESLSTIRQTLDGISGWGIHIHVAEDKADHTDAVRRGYRSVIDRLNKFDLINERSLIIHGIHMLPEDVELLEELGASLVHNPTSNANNRVGVLSAATIATLSAGLGTDGMQANMLKEAKEGTLIRSNSLLGGAPNVDYLQLLFENNSRIVSKIFANSLGQIQPGDRADLALYDYQSRTEITETNYGAHLLFGFDRPSDVICGGIFQIRDNKFTNLDETEIKSAARIQSRKLWHKMNRI
ncbi:MAG: amidohydrolase family protein [Candidatus Marinimicrobia bacterium]|nr:amidohydrolase family protein [Candidatus Neomarinimicrobiota bacterium]